MAPLERATKVPSHFHQRDVCEINVWHSGLAWSECVFQGPGASAECQFTFQECHFGTFYLPAPFFSPQPDNSGI